MAWKQRVGGGIEIRFPNGWTGTIQNEPAKILESMLDKKFVDKTGYSWSVFMGKKGGFSGDKLENSEDDAKVQILSLMREHLEDDEFEEAMQAAAKDESRP